MTISWLLHLLWMTVIGSCLWSPKADAYLKVRLQDYLCADKLLVRLQMLAKELSLTLGEDSRSSVLIHQVWNRTLSQFRSSNPNIRYDCSFQVYSSDRKSKHPRGIYLFITHLKFRRDPNTNKCIDYIQFRGDSGSPTAQYCDDISESTTERFIFDERTRDVTVIIHVDKKQRINEPLELGMVLTAHSECRHPGDFLCDPVDSSSCIFKKFVCDNVTNCKQPHRDELSCHYDGVSSVEIDTTNVALSAITSFIFTMLGVGFCVWVCWKYWKCITMQQHVYEASGSASASSPPPTLHTQTERMGNVMTAQTPVLGGRTLPSAPPLVISNGGGEGDERTFAFQQQLQHPESDSLAGTNTTSQAAKDLPPSYESLFPER